MRGRSSRTCRRSGSPSGRPHRLRPAATRQRRRSSRSGRRRRTSAGSPGPPVELGPDPPDEVGEVRLLAARDRLEVDVDAVDAAPDDLVDDRRREPGAGLGAGEQRRRRLRLARPTTRSGRARSRPSCPVAWALAISSSTSGAFQRPPAGVLVDRAVRAGDEAEERDRRGRGEVEPGERVVDLRRRDERHHLAAEPLRGEPELGRVVGAGGRDPAVGRRRRTGRGAPRGAAGPTEPASPRRRRDRPGSRAMPPRAAPSRDAGSGARDAGEGGAAEPGRRPASRTRRRRESRATGTRTAGGVGSLAGAPMGSTSPRGRSRPRPGRRRRAPGSRPRRARPARSPRSDGAARPATWAPSPGPSSRVGHRPVVVLEVEQEPAAHDEDRLVLALVVLERQPAAGLDHDHLAAVAVRQGPDQLVAPRLVDAPRRTRRPVAGHEPRTRRSPATSIASRRSADVASV